MRYGASRQHLLSELRSRRGVTKKMRHATLSEVARKAGVGTTTVSRVINGGQNVDPTTLARVQGAIDALGYMPNQAARTLKGDRTRTIGFIIPSIADPFFSTCAEAAQAIARANDSLLVVLTTQNDAKAELDAVHVLMRHRVDGFIIAPADSHSKTLQHLVSRLPVPVVALDRPIADSAVPCVVADNFAGAQLGTQHLIEHGYRRIVCFTGETELFTIQERMRGFRQTMTAAGLTPVIETGVRDLRSAEQTLDRILRSSRPPEAILTLKNSTTVDTFAVLQRCEVAVPTSVALLGYDDFQLAGTLRPSVSVIQQPIHDIGYIAAELLFVRLLAPSSTGGTDGDAPTEQIQLKTRLIRRASCGCVPDHP